MKFKNRQNSQFQQILDDINSFPPWVKEAILLNLKGELDRNTLKTLKAEDCIFLYVPKLTDAGEMFLKSCQSNNRQIDQRLYHFLMAVHKENNLFDITQDNNSTFQNICNILISGWKNGFIQPTFSKKIHSMVYFLAGKIDIGEYLFRIGRMTKQQFYWYTSMQNPEMVLFEEDVDNTEQQKINMEKTFLNLGYLSQYELQDLKALQEFSKSKVKIKSPSLILLDKIKNLNEQIVTLNISNNRLKEEKQRIIEEKDHYIKRINTLVNSIQSLNNEKTMYIREINSLKEELKKWLK
ncbi:MAG: hypothetical protein AB1782_00660 [Cyanobacteriota bacterium]